MIISGNQSGKSKGVKKTPKNNITDFLKKSNKKVKEKKKMNNYDVAHSFFYDLSGNFSKNYMNVSYNNYKFYSYYTCIGKVIEDLSGRNLLLVSADNFSNSMAKHINNLLGACPFNNSMYVPVNYGDRDININELESKIIKKLELYKNSKLSLKENRTQYVYYFDMLQRLNDKIIKVKKSVFKKYEKLYFDLYDSEKVKSIKKAESEKAKKNREKFIKALSSEVSYAGYVEVVETAKREEISKGA